MVVAIARIFVASGLMLAAAHLPSATTAQAATSVAKLISTPKVTRACPTRWAAVVRTCIA
ncbi:hypothetical protein [Methylobacterium nigriterrae]|uniref:hypothetical protein n=1 Tax=Methylobacterium nigriterrae TaxID=3127512 RepID=UPI0030137ABC